MIETKPKKPFKPVNIATDDWDQYNQLALHLSAERGERISIPALLKESVEYYKTTL